MNNLLIRCKPEPCCVVCGHRDDLWRNKFLLGSDAILCGYCFDGWYDGETDPAKLRSRSLDDRKTGRRERMKAKFGF